MIIAPFLDLPDGLTIEAFGQLWGRTDNGYWKEPDSAHEDGGNMRRTDSTGVSGQAVRFSETRCGSSEFQSKRITLFSLSEVRRLFSVAGVITSGCVNKEDLEKAEMRLSQVAAENKELSDQTTGLQQEKQG